MSVPLSAEALENITGRCIARIQTDICVRKLVIYTKMRLSHSDKDAHKKYCLWTYNVSKNLSDCWESLW